MPALRSRRWTTWLALAFTMPVGAADFVKEIKPLLAQRCVACHGPAKQKGGLRLDTSAGLRAGGASGPVVVPKASAKSLLLDHVLERQGASRMPPEGEPLAAAEIARLARWIDAGAETPHDPAAPSSVPKADGWVWQPLRRPALPKVPAELQAWVRNPIDAFLAAKLHAAGLRPAPEADRRTLIRRLSFDLLGLPPTFAEVEAFAADRSPDAYETLVERLLASPHYGERHARHWLDVAHYADSHGQEHDRARAHAWHYRDWLIRSFNDDLPYARFVAEQVAGDALRPGDPTALRATGFLAAGPWDESALVAIKADTLDRVAAEYLDRDDIVASAMSAFAGVTVACARCHDHKFDPVPQADYYALQAVFAGIEKGDREHDLDPATARRRAELAGEIARLTGLAGSSDSTLRTPAARQRAEDYERQWLARWGRWTTPEPAGWSAAAGTVLHALLDRSILAAGPRPNNDTYTIRLPAAGRFAALRLELLTDDTLPHRGPGRNDNGNLHLGELRVRAAGKPVAIAKAFSDHDESPAWSIQQAFDGNPATGWGIYPHVGKPHVGVFVFAAPLALPADGELTVELEQQTGGVHNLGRFRLSLAEQAPPAERPTPDPLDDLLARPAAQRTAAQRDEVTRAVLLQDATAALAALPAMQKVYAGKPRAEPKPIHILQRGDPAKPGAAATPGALAAARLPARFELPPGAPESARRAALAKWLTHPDHPLVWRTMANRAWHWRFGRGLVDTPNDLGKMGGTPSHPELLDWLAAELRDAGSLKRLHRLMATSAAYRQAFRHDPAAAAQDADNRLKWRGERRRLDAETIRDAMLAVSGRLDATMFGPPHRHFVPGPAIGGTPTADYDAFDLASPAGRRRSVYRYVFRNRPDPFLAALDCPDASLSAPVRTPTLGPAQALALWNNAFVLHHAERLAERAAAAAPLMTDRVRHATRLALQRDPQPVELAAWSAHAERHGLANLCRVLLNGSEFQFTD